MPLKKKGRIQGIGLVLSLRPTLASDTYKKTMLSGFAHRENFDNIMPKKPTDPAQMIHHDMINWRPDSGKKKR